ncbi:MAG: hypothetical protein AAB448_02660 [Patescibacteria group bacterium]
MQELSFLLFTIAVELPIAMVCLWKENRKQIAMTVAGINMISHPIIWWALFHYHINWFAAEIGVTTFETIAFAFLFPKHRGVAIATAILMNAVTAGIGYLM